MPFIRTVRLIKRLAGCTVLVASLACFGQQTDDKTQAQPQTQEELAANPGRPTVSAPATLTPVGYFQFEMGILGAQHSEEFADRTAINEVIKFTVAKRLELLVQSEPAVFSDLGAQHSRDAGGVSLGAQAVLLPGTERRPTLSVSYFRTVYDGTASDLDIGSSRNSAIFLLSTDVGKWHIDTNYLFNEQINNAVHRAQFGQTLSVAHPIAGKLAWTGELWHFTQPFLNGHAAGFLTGPAYSVTPRLVLDIGFNRGLTSTSTRWEFFTGFTYLLPKKLW
ncbi:MAG TPA: hypothetical protein VFP71_06950 [Candidatus Angelobacter sp.]|nr:hypothetical protein [Candidatus Angelobacter sp.]